MTLPRNRRLPGAMIDGLFRSGRKVVDPLAVMYWQPAPAGEPTRVAVVASRRLGGAVVRNRLRRRFKEGFRRYVEQIHPGYRFIFVIRHKAIGAPGAIIEQAVKRLLRAGGLLTTPGMGSDPVEGDSGGSSRHAD